jgi:hypothetical protein
MRFLRLRRPRPISTGVLILLMWAAVQLAAQRGAPPLPAAPATPQAPAGAAPRACERDVPGAAASPRRSRTDCSRQRALRSELQVCVTARTCVEATRAGPNLLRSAVVLEISLVSLSGR